MWLLDEGLPRALFESLNNLGVKVETVDFRKWKGFRNGKLVTVATEAGFTCILTKDKLFAQDAKKALVANPKMGVVLVTLPQVPRKKYGENFAIAWKKGEIVPVSGQVIEWPALK